MKIGIYSRLISDDFGELMQDMMHFFQTKNIQLQLYHKLSEQLISKKLNISNYETFSSYKDFDQQLDLMISIGGDGTFLEAVTFIRETGIPILGINSGRLGFLADIAPNEILDALADFANGKYSIEKRSLLELTAPGLKDCSFNYALNDFTIRKSDKATLIKIHTWVNEEFLNTYWADGLIVSTPTGSTAYSLSVGGPIMVPESNNLIIIPIASHNLTVRPLVINADHDITLNVESRISTHIASLDARTFAFDKNVNFRLKKANFAINVVKIQGHSYFNTIRNKLMWGIDKRN